MLHTLFAGLMLFRIFLQAVPVREYVCHHTDSPIVVDGSLDEPAWDRAPRSEPFCDIRGETWPQPRYGTWVKMLRDETHLYIAALIEEPCVKATLLERDAIIWRENDFEVFLDPDGDGRLYFEFEINALGTVLDLVMDKPYAEGGKYFIPWDCRGLQSAVRISPAGRDFAGGWTVEMAIPFASLAVGGVDPGGLSTWRINFSRVEWLREGGPEENWVWAPTGEVDIHRPDRWGKLLFAPPVTPGLTGHLTPGCNDIPH